MSKYQRPPPLPEPSGGGWGGVWVETAGSDADAEQQRRWQAEGGTNCEDVICRWRRGAGPMCLAAQLKLTAGTSSKASLHFW